jgi:NAD(P)-dependent dehydrogenase (short-subunit alcohol dehydrogenase family)
MANVAGPFFTIRALLPLIARPGKIGVVSSKMGSQQMAGGGRLRLSRLKGRGEQSGAQPRA